MTEREWFKEESDMYKEIKQAQKTVWEARMHAVELTQEFKNSYQSPIYEAYNTIKCAYELLETAKVLIMIHFDDLIRKAEGG